MNLEHPNSDERDQLAYEAFEENRKKNDRNSMVLDLAFTMRDITNIDLKYPTEESAQALFFDVVLDKKCPECNEKARREGGKLICEGKCKLRTSLTAKTPLKNTKIRLNLWLACIWHIYCDTAPISSRHFSRKYNMRPMTAWELFHKVRQGLQSFSPSDSTVRRQILGKTSKAPNETVALSSTSGEMCAVPEEDGIITDAPFTREDPLWTGHFNAIITSVYGGVSKKYFDRYCAEYSRRFKLVKYWEARNWTKEKYCSA